MVIKLYKREPTRTLYWEGFTWENKVAFRQAIVGQVATPGFVIPSKGQTASKIIKARAAEMKSEGYKPIADEEHSRVIIQYHVVGWGSSEDLDRRDRVEEAIHDQLGEMGAGAVDGGDIGSGTINVFCFVIDPDVVIPGVIDRLKRDALLDGAVIAVNSPGEAGSPKVIWPPDFKGEFKYM